MKKTVNATILIKISDLYYQKMGAFANVIKLVQNLVKLRGKSSGLLLKNILGNKFPIKLSNFIKWEFIENLWTSMCFGGII